MKKVLQQSSVRIDRLLQHNKYLEYLSKRLLTYLPSEFSKKIAVLGFSKSGTEKQKQQSLIVSAISPAWASKLRFYTPTLKRSLCAEPQFNQLHKIIIRVASSHAKQNKARQGQELKMNSLPIYSQKSASIIHDSAQCIDNLELKNALIRLAHNVARPLKKK